MVVVDSQLVTVVFMCICQSWFTVDYSTRNRSTKYIKQYEYIQHSYLNSGSNFKPKNQFAGSQQPVLLVLKNEWITLFFGFGRNQIAVFSIMLLCSLLIVQSTMIYRHLYRFLSREQITQKDSWLTAGFALLFCSCCCHLTLTFIALLHRTQITTLKCLCLTSLWMWRLRLSEHWQPLWQRWWPKRL